MRSWAPKTSCVNMVCSETKKLEWNWKTIEKLKIRNFLFFSLILINVEKRIKTNCFSNKTHVFDMSKIRKKIGIQGAKYQILKIKIQISDMSCYDHAVYHAHMKYIYMYINICEHLYVYKHIWRMRRMLCAKINDTIKPHMYATQEIVLSQCMCIEKRMICIYENMRYNHMAWHAQPPT